MIWSINNVREITATTALPPFWLGSKQKRKFLISDESLIDSIPRKSKITGTELSTQTGGKDSQFCERGTGIVEHVPFGQGAKSGEVGIFVVEKSKVGGGHFILFAVW